MAQRRDELLDHDYDGIREYDNVLPRWWLWLFYGTILFAVIYSPYYLFGFGPSTGEMYEMEVAEARMARPAPTAPSGGAPGATGGAAATAEPSLQGNAEAIAAGGEIFKLNCVPCHGPLGEGGIGPNLTDRYWLHGGSYDNIVHTITEGVPAKGMISWKTMLNPTKIRQAAAFVMSLQGSNPPNAKEPQGEEYNP